MVREGGGKGEGGGGKGEGRPRPETETLVLHVSSGAKLRNHDAERLLTIN